MILDLEDAVAAERKSHARDQVLGWTRDAVKAGGVHLVVRINAVGTPAHSEDLLCVAQLPANVTVMLTKAEPESMCELCSGRLRSRSTIALVESVAGFLGLRTIAAVPGISRIAFGNVDFALDAGITPADDEIEFAAVRSALVLESRFALLPPPIDGVLLETSDMSRIGSNAHRARRMGFGGKLCIHPGQVAAVNLAFSATPAELDQARGVIAAFEESKGSAVALDGRMIDGPVVEIARRIVASTTA